MIVMAKGQVEMAMDGCHHDGYFPLNHPMMTLSLVYSSSKDELLAVSQLIVASKLM